MERLVGKIEGLESAGFYSDNGDTTVLDLFRMANIGHIKVAKEPYELFNQTFDAVGISSLNLQDALYLVYDLFNQRAFNSSSILCTNITGDFTQLETKVKEVLNDTSVRGYLMGIPNPNSVLENIGKYPLTSSLMFCSRPDHKFVHDVLELPHQPYMEKAKLNLPTVSQVAQQVQVGMGGKMTRARAVQCSVNQGNQLIYAAFSDKPLPYTVLDADRFMYENSYWDFLMIDDCAELMDKVRPLVKGKAIDRGYVLNGTGREYAKNIRLFSELAIQYDSNLKRMFSLIRMLEQREDIISS
jgi:hypothetical protein